MIALGSLSSLGYGPLANVTVHGHAVSGLLRLPDQLGHDADCGDCDLPAGFPRRRAWTRSSRRLSWTARQRFRRKRVFTLHDPLALPGLCRRHSGKLGGQCVWNSLKCDRKEPFPGVETVLFCFIRDAGQGSAGGYRIRPYGLRGRRHPQPVEKCIVGASTARPQKRCGSRSAAGPSGTPRPAMLLFLLRLVPQHLLRKMPCKELHERS